VKGVFKSRADSHEVSQHKTSDTFWEVNAACEEVHMTCALTCLTYFTLARTDCRNVF
jgi:hypothetical protein